MAISAAIDALLRWIHILAGIVWIGHLYFFNFVNGLFQATMDGPTKKGVNPQLLPRALFWFRYGALWTWITGVLMLLSIFYMGHIVMADGGSPTGMAYLLLLLTIVVAPFVYDTLIKTGLSANMNTAAAVGLAITAGLMMAYEYLGGFGYRGVVIHVGALFGTLMAYNVWFRIWPAQRAIITAVKQGTAPDAALVALAGLRSRHNTYMSVPLVFFMLNQHNLGWAANPITNGVMVLVGFGLVYYLYDAAGKVKGI